MQIFFLTETISVPMLMSKPYSKKKWMLSKVLLSFIDTCFMTSLGQPGASLSVPVSWLWPGSQHTQQQDQASQQHGVGLGLSGNGQAWYKENHQQILILSQPPLEGEHIYKNYFIFFQLFIGYFREFYGPNNGVWLLFLIISSIKMLTEVAKTMNNVLNVWRRTI